MSKYLIGIDIGGTTIKFGVISLDGHLLYKWDIHTNTENAGSHIVKDIWNSLQRTLTNQKIEKETVMGIGVGIPGFVHSDSGVVHEAINIGWKHINLKEQLEGLIKLPVYIENDANTAVLGENWKGAGNHVKHVIAVTLGTGVGGGIISNGQILNGQNGMAGELGHIVVEAEGVRCNCGNTGCLETIASARGIVRQAKEKLADFPYSSLNILYKEKKRFTAKDIFEHAEKGDPLANEVINYTTKKLAYIFANLGVILNPERILIGGGVAKAGQLLLERINTSFRATALPRVIEACEIKFAELGNDAGIIGAAYLVKQNVEETSF